MGLFAAFSFVWTFFLDKFRVQKNDTNATTVKQPVIVIIGAGISGLAAADRLINEHQFENVTILEALNRVGGRIDPLPFGDGYIQMGAEWLHDRHNPIFEMALKLKLIPSADAAPENASGRRLYIDQNGCPVEDRLVDVYKRFCEEKYAQIYEIESARESNANASSLSFGSAMAGFYQQFITDPKSKYSATDLKIFDAMFRCTKSGREKYYAAEDWNKISIRDFSDTSNNDDNTTLKENSTDEGFVSISMNKFGYKLILDEMTNRVPPSKYVQFNSRVQRINYDLQNQIEHSKLVRIELSDGRVLEADHVIVTCSLGHLKQYADQLFDPPLPKRKMDIIRALGFGTVDKLQLIFDKQYWPDDTFSINLIRVGETAGLAAGNATDNLAETNLTLMFENMVASKIYSNVLLVWIGGKHPPEFENASDIDVAEAAAKVLRKYLNNPAIPAPQILRSSWHSDPMFHGSYSYDSVDCDKIECRRKDLSEPLTVLKHNRKIPVVLFAGEATNSDQYATTHGAFETGLREADRLNDFYNTNK